MSVSMVFNVRMLNGELTATSIVAIIIARPAHSRALIVLAIMLPLQSQGKRQPAERSSHTHSLTDAVLLLAHGAAGPAGTLTVPPAAAGCGGTARVVVVFDVGCFFVGVLALFAADAEDAQERVEEGARAAEEAEEQEEEDAQEYADDDAGDGAAGEAGRGLRLGEGAAGAGGDGGLEGHGRGGGAGVCDDD